MRRPSLCLIVVRHGKHLGSGQFSRPQGPFHDPDELPARVLPSEVDLADRGDDALQVVVAELRRR